MPIHVLVVEDEILVAIDLEFMIRNAVAADVSIATSLVEAREALAEPVDYVFLDINVSDGQTLEIAHELVARHVPVAFVTASPQASLAPELQHLPFVAKPPDYGRIAALLRDRWDRTVASEVCSR